MSNTKAAALTGGRFCFTEIQMEEYDYLIVGAGLFGSVFAYCMEEAGRHCLVIDSRDHIGGNCYTEDVGVSKFFLGKWCCLKLKDADHLELVQFVESAITQFEPDIIITHHPNDLNNDHYIASIICYEASRLPQRSIGYSKRIKNILAMEVPSETDWHFNPAWDAFKPNTYHEVSEEALEAKIKAISVYQDVIRPAPHPRSPETLRALATVRGSEAGSLYAEAFQSIFKLGV